MIPFNFIYCRPDTLDEAVQVYTELQKEGKAPFYYSGGSEIITMARAGSICPGAVIDIKNIPECKTMGKDRGKLVLGAGNTLNQIKEAKMFPLLASACGRVADHTNQCRITLGGNLCGTVIYRETSLPLMLSDAEALLYGPEGARTALFHKVFQKRMLLKPGELIVQIHIPLWALTSPWVHIKKTAQEKIDYPLVNVTALKKEGSLRVGFSGLCAFPFRSREIEHVLNDRQAPIQARVNAIPALLPEPPHNDREGSGAYRLFVLKNTLQNILEEWENGAI